MILHAPFEISPRLMPALHIGGAWLSIEPSGQNGEYGKPGWRYYIDLPNGHEITGDDMHGWGDTQEMFACLLSFLSAAAESYAYRMQTGRNSENEDLFPPVVVEWAYQNSDEIGILAFEIEDSKYPRLIED